MGIICSSVPKGFLSVSAEEIMKKNEQRVKSNATLKSSQREEKLRVENPSKTNIGKSMVRLEKLILPEKYYFREAKE